MKIRIIEETPWLEAQIQEAIKEFTEDIRMLGYSFEFNKENGVCTVEMGSNLLGNYYKAEVNVVDNKIALTPRSLNTTDNYIPYDLAKFLNEINKMIESAERAERLACRENIFKDYETIRETIDIAWNVRSNDNLMKLSYSLDAIMEYGCSLDTYIKILEYMIANGFDEIVDIGIAYGWQAKIFLDNNIKYTGVDRYNHLIVYKNKPNFRFIHGTYPNVDIEKQGNKTLGVANMSLGWGMFDEDISLVVEKLRDDFDTAIVYVQKDFIEECSKYFDIGDMGNDDWNRNLKLLKRKKRDDGLFKAGKVGR